MNNVSERFGHKRRMSLNMHFFHNLQENSTALYSFLDKNTIDCKQIEALWIMTFNEIYLKEIILNQKFHQSMLKESPASQIVKLDALSGDCNKILDLIFNSSSSIGPISAYKFESYINGLKDYKIKYYYQVWAPMLVSLFVQLKESVYMLSVGNTIIFRARHSGSRRFVDIGYKLKSEKNTKALLQKTMKVQKTNFLLIRKVYKKVYQLNVRKTARKGMCIFSFEI